MNIDRMIMLIRSNKKFVRECAAAAKGGCGACVRAKRWIDWLERELLAYAERGS